MPKHDEDRAAWIEYQHALYRRGTSRRPALVSLAIEENSEFAANRGFQKQPDLREE